MIHAPAAPSLFDKARELSQVRTAKNRKNRRGFARRVPGPRFLRAMPPRPTAPTPPSRKTASHRVSARWREMRCYPLRPTQMRQSASCRSHRELLERRAPPQALWPSPHREPAPGKPEWRHRRCAFGDGNRALARRAGLHTAEHAGQGSLKQGLATCCFAKSRDVRVRPGFAETVHTRAAKAGAGYLNI